MNINDIMQRDMLDEERREGRRLKRDRRNMTLKEYDRGIRRRLWRHRLVLICEVIGSVVFFAIIGAFCLLCCAVSDYNWQ